MEHEMHCSMRVSNCAAHDCRRSGPNHVAPPIVPPFKPTSALCTHYGRHGEPFNVLRYELSQHYDSHYDSFGGCLGFRF